MTPRLLSALSLVVALGALGLTLFRPDTADKKAAARERTVPLEPPPAAIDEELEGKVAALEWVVSALSRRLETVETSLSRYPVGADAQNRPAQLTGDVGQRVEALQKDVDALFAAGVLDTEHGRERAKDIFRELQGEIATERFRAREESREQQRKERVQKFAQEARLSGVQQQRLETLLDGEVSQRRALMEQLQAGGRDRGEIFAELRGLREKTDTAAREILPGDDYDKYREMRRADGDRGQGGRGGNQGQARQGGRSGEERARPAEGGRGRREAR